MSALAFDTLRAVKALCEADAAGPLVETIDDAKTGLEASVAAVRTDINETETAQCADIAKVQAELKTDISSVRTGLEAKIA